MSDWISAIVGGSIAVVGGCVSYYYYYFYGTEDIEYRQSVILRLLSGIFMSAGIVAQLVHGGMEYRAMVVGTSPTFLALTCLSLICLEPIIIDLAYKCAMHKNYTTLWSVVLFHYVSLIGFITWMFQFAVHTKNESASIGLYVTGAVFALVVVWIFTWVYRLYRKPSRHTPHRVFMFTCCYTGGEEGEQQEEEAPFVSHPTNYPHDTIIDNNYM